VGLATRSTFRRAGWRRLRLLKSVRCRVAKLLGAMAARWRRRVAFRRVCAPADSERRIHQDKGRPDVCGTPRGSGCVRWPTQVDLNLTRRGCRHIMCRQE